MAQDSPQCCMSEEGDTKCIHMLNSHVLIVHLHIWENVQFLYPLKLVFWLLLHLLEAHTLGLLIPSQICMI